MRINKYVAAASGLSRRAADQAIGDGRVTINGRTAQLGDTAADNDEVYLDTKRLELAETQQTILLHKPVGYVVSRDGQGSLTVYDLLPAELQHLKPIGRLDKDSSGLLLLTTDGDLANELTHPSRQKRKTYLITLDKPLQPLHRQLISETGITLDDGQSQLQLSRITEGDDTAWTVVMHEGRNRQIRRTFQALGYRVIRLHREQFGPYQLGDLASGSYTAIS